MKITRLYAGEDGESHFEEVDVPLEDRATFGRVSELHEATGILFRETASDYHLDWHNAPRRQFILTLEGEVEIEVGDGTRRHFGPGDVLLAEDTTGRGHISRTLAGRKRRMVFVTLD